METDQAISVSAVGKIPHIRSGPYLGWSEKVRCKLQKLTLQCEMSAMRIVTCGGNPLTCVAFLDSEPIGWSLYTDKYFVYDSVIMVYVHPSYRRVGIGRLLAKSIREISGKEIFLVIAWSQESLKFFESIKDQFPINIKVDFNDIQNSDVGIR